MYDIIIVGGGPAGLSAALVLGRCRRKVLICDTGKPRNKPAKAMHGYLTRDGISPLEFLKLAKKEILKYDIKIESRFITNAAQAGNGFELTDSNSNKLYSKRILISTGVTDTLPAIEGIEQMYGKSVFHCPYCDGWEVGDKKIAVYGKGKSAYMLAFSLKTWSSNVFIVTNGKSYMRNQDKEKLLQAGIKIYYNKIQKLAGNKGMVKSIVFSDGESIKCDAMFFTTEQKQHSNLAGQLGCRFDSSGFIRTDKKQHTGVNGVFVAGDAAKDMKFVIVAAAEGARAGVAINISLQEEERKNF